MKALLALAIALGAAFAAGCGGEGVQPSGYEHCNSPLRQAPAGEVLSRNPYMGVSCKIPNSFACDRVGLAVWLREPAVSVNAAIAGSEFQLDDPGWSGRAEDGKRRMFAGFLQPAGLIDGALQVTPDAGHDRWIGREPVSTTVTLWIVGDPSATTTTTVEVGLSPGWG